MGSSASLTDIATAKARPQETIWIFYLSGGALLVAQQ